MLIRIDPNVDRPIYLQIASAIEDQIAMGSLSVGDRLPSARDLSSSLGINMHTALKAYAHLQECSLVEMKRGRGGVVVSKAADVERSARQLVSIARTRGWSRAQLMELVEQVWR
jgi:GntR family transcriptional regulator